MARPHPYAFAHVLVPQLAGRRPAAVRRELADPALARELLLYMWEKAAEGLPPAEHVSSRGLRLTWHEVAGRAVALLHLPAPQASTEAHFGALVYENDEEDYPDDEEADDDDDDSPGAPGAPPEALDAPRPRYFLLEATLGRSSDEAGTPTAVGEWRGEHYRQLGRGPAAGRPDTAPNFLKALAQVLGPLPGAGVPYMRIAR
ncbi:hypothetical protein [Hymenobacter sp. PAMC 26628]|uniref:hypothetical protein n=1 Tax=Hymenobacter sp. PAMC 26628 TaxID=1484118 RepID=UPI0007704C58|nr:hypothetical protein [Hymenobacter sp. PAMC 26628]AMJ66516.1 hypothetical protein AXW84_14560 [Hymenobacter sp. PAMC 26628]